jgi:hypothetical protein
MPSSLPSQPPTPYNDAFSRPDYSANYSPATSSSRELTALPASGPAAIRRQPLAFAQVRHRVDDEEAARVGIEPRHSES